MLCKLTVGSAVTAILIATAITQTSLTAAERATAPYGYIVTYGFRDGKPLSDGKQYRIAVVTQNYVEALRTLNYYNSIHMYRANIMDLKTEAQFKAAQELQRDPNVGRPRPDGGAGSDRRPVTGQVAGARYQVEGTTFSFKADGSVTTNYGTSGRWTQSGNNVIWSIAEGPFVFRYTGSVSGSGESMTIYSSVYNPKTGNEGQKRLNGLARRLP